MKMEIIKYFYVLINCVAYTLATPDPTAEFFPDVNGNLTAITWAHAVNNQSLLESALNDTVMMLEADVVIGTLNDEPIKMPILGHPPATNSDLSLQNFLQAIQEYNMNTTSKKGIKLDFKTIEAMEKSSPILEKIYPKLAYPVWLNADILPGPLNTTDPPVDPVRFVNVAKKFSNATLSIGWKTLYGGNITNASYTDEHINKMIEIIQASGISHPITFPVRAGIAAQSVDQLESIINSVNDSTLTLWNFEGDYVEIEPLRELLHRVGLSKVYVDLPDNLKNKLELDGYKDASKKVKPFTILSILLVALIKLV